MYHFSYFKDKERQSIMDFMESHPFAFVTGSFASGTQVATQVPVLIEERNGELFLQGHIMRNTDHHKAFMENASVLTVFSGPHAYVSGTWYSKVHIASTWNYMSVHVAGSLRFMSEQELVALMRKTTLKFEQGNQESATIYDNLPEAFINKMIPAIVGFEIQAKKLDHVFKLSQNRDKDSYMNIISRLQSQGGDSALIAAEMKKRIDVLFPEGQQWDPSRFDS